MICFPLDNTEYSAVAPGSYLSSRTRGVFSAEENLAVYTNGDMTIRVTAGIAWLKKEAHWGVSAYNEQDLALTIATADGSLSRIDAVCCRLDKNANKAEIVIKKGAYATNPVVAAPERSSNYDELYLATIRVGAGVYAINQSEITDQRLNEAYCGLMRDGVTGIPTAQLQLQAEALLALIRQELANINDGTEFMLKTEYAGSAIGTVKNADSLGGQAASYFATAAAASAAQTTANAAQTTASAAQTTANGALKRTGGTMTGNVLSNYATVGNTTGYYFRGSAIQNSAGTQVSSANLVFRRK